MRFPSYPPPGNNGNGSYPPDRPGNNKPARRRPRRKLDPGEIQTAMHRLYTGRRHPCFQPDSPLIRKLMHLFDGLPVRAFESRLLIFTGFFATLGKSDQKAFLQGAAAVEGPAGKGFRLAVRILLPPETGPKEEEEDEEEEGDWHPGANGKAT